MKKIVRRFVRANFCGELSYRGGRCRSCGHYDDGWCHLNECTVSPNGSCGCYN